MAELYLFSAFLIVVNDKLISDFVSWVIDDNSDGRDILIFVQNVVLWWRPWYLLKMLQLMIKCVHFFAGVSMNLRQRTIELLCVLKKTSFWPSQILQRRCYECATDGCVTEDDLGVEKVCKAEAQVCFVGVGEWKHIIWPTDNIPQRHGFVCLFVCLQDRSSSLLC